MALTTTVTLSGTTYGGVPFSHSQSGVSLPQDATYNDGIKYTAIIAHDAWYTLSWGGVTTNAIALVIVTNRSATDGNYLKVSFDGGSTEHGRIPPLQTQHYWVKVTPSGVSGAPEVKADFQMEFTAGTSDAEITIIETAY